MRESHRKETQDSEQVRLIAGRRIVFDKEGFLKDFDDWSEELFGVLAKECGLREAGELHWRVIRFLREFYSANGRVPLNRLLKEGAGMSLSEIEKLFPGGVKYGARRLAGLPNPQGCM